MQSFLLQGGQPCSTCSKRGHPDICCFSGESEPHRAGHQKRHEDSLQDVEQPTLQNASSASSPSPTENSELESWKASQTAHEQSTQVIPPAEYPSAASSASGHPSSTTTVGGLSGAVFVQERLRSRGQALSRDVRSGLGLENVLPNSPSNHIRAQSNSICSEMLEGSPQRAEILRFI